MNHRVFERKWRSRFHREHVCLSILLNCATCPVQEKRSEASSCRRTSLEVTEPSRRPRSATDASNEAFYPANWWRGLVLFGQLSDSESQIRRDHPLNLSILISGGKETNKDSPSNGERSGNSSSLKSLAVTVRELWPGEAAVPGLLLSKLTWKGTSERVRAPCATPTGWATTVFGESGCLGMQPKVGGKLHLKLNTGTRPIANKYHEGKVKSTLKRESKRPRNR